MGLIRKLEKCLEMSIGVTYDEFGISERIEEILTNEAVGNKLKMIVVFNQPPLFLRDNSGNINRHLHGGSLEVLTQNPLVLSKLTPPLPDYLQIHKKRVMIGDVKLYLASREMKYEFAVLLDYVIRRKDNDFLLNNNPHIVSKYLKYFEEMKKSEFVSRYDPLQAFPFKPTF